MPVKNKKEDKIFALLVKERVNYNCEKCGRNFRQEGMDCSHNVPRRHVATKWHPVGACAHCRSCHRVFTDNPIQHTRWLDEYLGPDLVDELNRVAHTPVHWTPVMREDIYKHMLAEYDKMLERRKTQPSGEIPFAAHPLMHVFGDS